MCQFIVNGKLTVHKNDCVDGRAVYGGIEPLIHYDSVPVTGQECAHRLDTGIFPACPSDS